MEVNCRLFDLVDIDIFPPTKSCGVYAVCIKQSYRSIEEKIVYIGSAKNIRKRVDTTNHPYSIFKNRYPNRCVYVKEIECDNFMEIERMLIAEYKPILNKQHRNGERHLMVSSRYRADY